MNTTNDQSAPKNPAPRSALKPVLLSLGAIGLLGLAGYGVTRYMADQEASQSTTASQPESALTTESQDLTATNVSVGTLTGDQPIQRIKVTIHAGPDAAINETVDLHLGFGFPLRLSPLGGQVSGPVFAALPTDSSIEVDQATIPAGGSAWFEFDRGKQAAERDPLKTTRTLLADLKVSDLAAVGFATRGQTNWTLTGYKIEVNGTIYDAKDSYNQRPKQINQYRQKQVSKLVAHHEALVQDVKLRRAVVQTGLASEQEKAELDAKEIELSELRVPLKQFGGQLLGQYPTLFQPSFDDPLLSDSANRIASIRVQLTVQGGQQTGTRNPVYLQTGGRKFLLASELSPLSDDPGPQTFEISPVDLMFDPVSQSDVENFAIGVLGSNEPFDRIADRAKLQRVVLEVDGEVAFDSQANDSDRRSLAQTTLIPPAHRDGVGEVVVNADSQWERFAWRPGVALPIALAGTSSGGPPDLPIEPVPPGSTYTVPGYAGPQTPSFGSIGGGPGIGTMAGTSGATGAVPSGPAGALPSTGSSTPQPLQSGFPPIRSRPKQGQSRIRSSDIVLAILLADLLDRLKANPNSNTGSSTNSGTTPGTNPAANPDPGTSTGATAGSGTSPTPGLVPAAKELQIKNVRFGDIDRTLALPRDGNESIVQWEVENDQDVKEFQVRLWAILPHDPNRAPVLISESARVPNVAPASGQSTPGTATPRTSAPTTNPAASQTTIGQRATNTQEIDLASSGLEQVEWARAFVQPEVIAFDSNDQPIQTGASGKGPMLPLKTVGSDEPLVFLPWPDLRLQKVTDPNDVVGYQVDGDGYLRSSIPWVQFPKQPTNDGMSAWVVEDPTSTHNALMMEAGSASPVIGISSWDKQVTLRFDNELDLDANYRLVGHIGFLNGSPTADNKIEIGARMIVQNLSGNIMGLEEPHKIAAIDSTDIPQDLEVLRIETSDLVTYEKQGAATPLMMIDIPIALDLKYDDYTQALDELGTQNQYPTLTGLKINPKYKEGNPSAGLQLEMGLISKGLVSLTLMLKTEKQVADEAIGLFGFRLVKDPVQPESPLGFKGMSASLEDQFKIAYDEKMANPAYEAMKNEDGLPSKPQSMVPEEAEIKKIRSEIAKSLTAPSGVTPTAIPHSTGSSPTIDGRFAGDEWSDAASVDMGENSKLYLIADDDFLFLGCDVPKETTEQGFEQFRFYIHVNATPLLAYERVDINGSSYTSSEKLFGLRQTSIRWTGDPGVRSDEWWKNGRINDWNIYEQARAASVIDGHRRYEVKLQIAEIGLHRNVPFPAWSEIETDPEQENGKYKARKYLGQHGSRDDPAWFVMQ